MNEPDVGPQADEDLANDPERWDANDSRRQKDCFAPPSEPCECYCLHCQRTFMSDKIWFQKVIGDKHLDGFWMCPTPNCSGAGFTFDIFPTDPDHPANAGWVECDYDEDEFDEEGNPIDPAEREYDPDEPKFKALDEEYGDEDDDDDIEGEEWKHGLAPGDAPPEPEWVEKARKEWEEEQKKYDEPDRRPRELDWTGRQDEKGESQFREDDIPF
jgi:hypothetical protein